MVSDYSDYEPMLLERAGREQLKSAAYRRFILAAGVTPGVRLLLARHRGRPDWPFVDTKFNPNTGRDLGPESYGVVFGWFLGRGAEALDGHLGWLEQLEDLSADERAEADELFRRLVANQAGAINQCLANNGGRVPFRLDLSMRGVDERGRPVVLVRKQTGAADIFCGKGLIADGSRGNGRKGWELLTRSAQAIRANRYVSDQFAEQPTEIGQGSRMLMLSAAPLVCRKATGHAMRTAALDLAAEFIDDVLDRHFDPATGVFSEYIDGKTRQRTTYLDPGHANEFAGLGLAAIEAMAAEPALLSDRRRQLIQRAKRELPRVLISSTGLGWNAAFGGLHKAVDHATGAVLNDEMPWWSLPETMRAAARSAEVAEDAATADRCLELLRLCHNAYFGRYLNRDKMLFPFQTISGSSGEVVDKVPAVPEGDPLYHSNLALLDMLTVLDRL